RGRRRVRALLLQQAGRTRYGAAAPRLFADAPLVQGIYHDTLLFYWLVPPARACAALRDLVAMLERVLARLPDRRESVQFALHAARFAVDAGGEWRTAGKAA